ncbi:UvrD-helicase domain-containing protein [Nocardia aurantia]|uniref:DNA 3'-5' helicase n=1 Tax=Nocardia aurantia TaxID=2585199 RepID=A0A7K0DRC9_9NOCA|nr:UvrD-helicase domain-containing protein [Nocardia aurantia]MQY28330.1 ATP-dependent DNA helicase Rep [Nocardia aurantia]
MSERIGRRPITPRQLADALGLPPPTDEQAAVIAAPPGPTLVVAGAGAGKTETMAARVVWMVANGIVVPDQVLGLTFTRKAAQQLTTRIRTRLSRLAGAPLLRDIDPDGRLRSLLTGSEPEISTYHSYAGRLLSEHGLLMPVEPSSTLLTETQLWQLAHRVVTTWDGDLDTDRTPVSVTEAVLALSGQLAEHLVEPQQLVEAHAELEKLILTLPKGPRQRGGPSKELMNILEAQHERVALLPLVQRLTEELRRRGALDFGSQMSLAARLAAEHQEVGRAERTRFRLVLLDEYQDTGHAQRILLAALFGDLDAARGPDPAHPAPPDDSPPEPGSVAAERHSASGAPVHAVGGTDDPARSPSPSGRTSERSEVVAGEGYPDGSGRDSARAESDAAVRHSADSGSVASRGGAAAERDPDPSDADSAAARREAVGDEPYPADSGRRPLKTEHVVAERRMPRAGPPEGARTEDAVGTRGASADGPAVADSAATRGRVAAQPESADGDSERGGVPGDAAPRHRLAVTAVGDPMQSIYGWRGASAANLPRFTTDFPVAPGVPAPILPLLTSWRNPPEALDLANLVADPLRDSGVAVDALRPRPDATPGIVALALTETVAEERDWVAERIAAEWEAHADEGLPPPTSAVLVRRNADATPLAEALRERGLPVEIVGLGGLLATPEVADVVATLRLIADPGAGGAAMRILTGARWRIGVTDLAALARRARELSILRPAEQAATITDPVALAEALRTVAPEPAEQAGLADAIADPGPPEHYSEPGHQRIVALGRELAALRERSGQSLPELVADVERTIAVGVETQARRAAVGGGAGREHLDAFAEVVAGYAGDHRATLPGLLAFLTAAEEVENGLEPGEVEVARDRVQILTVHAAKGLEWEVVAVPHVARGVFPSGNAAATWLGALAELPTSLRGDRQRDPDGPDAAAREGVPVLDLENLYDRTDLQRALDQHKDALHRRRVDEERRLFYVALTRTERALFVSAHHWAETGATPKGPSDFLLELKHATEVPGSPSATAVRVDTWSDPPPADAVNPFTDNPASASWPRDPLGKRRAAVESGAALVRAALSQPIEPGPSPIAGPAARPGLPPSAGPGMSAHRESAARPAEDIIAPSLSGKSVPMGVADRPRSASASAGPAGHPRSGTAESEPGPSHAFDGIRSGADESEGEPAAARDRSEAEPDRSGAAPLPDRAQSAIGGSAMDSGGRRSPRTPAVPTDTPHQLDLFADLEPDSPAARDDPPPDPDASGLPDHRFLDDITDPGGIEDFDDDPDGWAADVDALLAEHLAAESRETEVELPAQLPATALVEMRDDPAKLAARLRRPLPFPPSPFARRGTAFHAWLQQWFGATQLMELDALPGAADSDGADAELVRLQEAFLSSEWADRNPVEVEIAFETSIAGTLLRGRMDAVFAESGGRWLVVDWKTGSEPTRAEEAAVAMQLAVYRLAWARLMSVRTGAPESELLTRIGAAFHYVRSGRTIAPRHLPGPAELARLIDSAAPAWKTVPDDESE